MRLGGLDLLCPVSSVVGIASSTKLDFGIRRLSWAARGGGGGLVAMWELKWVVHFSVVIPKRMLHA